MSINFFKINNGIALNPQASEPTGTDGEIYYNSSLNKFRRYENGAWGDLGGGGASTYTITAGEALSAGDLVYISAGNVVDSGRTLGRVYKLDATNATRYVFAGVNTTAVSAAATATISVSGQQSYYSSLLQGFKYYASVTTPGALQDTPPVLLGQYVVPVGTASTTTAIVIENIGSSDEGKITNRRSEDINYVVNPNFEISTGGWSTYADAAATIPVDGTGGSPVSTISTGGSSLRGTKSLLFNKGAANRQGEGFSYTFTIDDADKAKVLDVSFDYIITTGTFVAATTSTDSDLRVFLYDVTNSTLIYPSTTKLFSNSSTISDKFQATFQTASNSTSYRLIVHVGSTSALGYSVSFDNFIVSPSKYVFGTPITDWARYVPVLSSSSGSITNATTDARWRRVGSDIEVIGRTTFSAASAVFNNFIVGLPSELSFQSSNTYFPIGIATFFDTGVASYPGSAIIATSTTVVIYPANASGTYVADNNTTNTVPFTFGNTDTIEFKFSGAITGWSSAVQMSDSADTRKVVMIAQLSGSPSVATGVESTAQFATTLYDTHGAYNNTSYFYTIPVSDFYRVSLNTTWQANATGLRYIGFRIDNDTTGVAMFDSRTASSTNTTSSGISQIAYLTAGQRIYPRVNQTSGATITYTDNSFSRFSIERIMGPAAIAATETIAARYYTTAGPTINNTTPTITFGTKVFDTHSMYSSGIVTVPASGKYLIQSSLKANAVSHTAGQGFGIQVFKNGTINSTLGFMRAWATASIIMEASGSAIIDCVAGDQLTVRGYSDTSTTLNTTEGSNVNYFSIARIGI